MFTHDGILYHSSLISSFPEVRHGFSTKEGGVSTHPYTASLNLAPGREDDDETVRKNISIFASAISNGKYDVNNTVCAHQIHSDIIRTVSSADCGDGSLHPSPIECDGYVTMDKGVMIFVRIADCTPILLCGYTHDSKPIISAVHAGWRGTAIGIAKVAVQKMVSLGCDIDTIKCAIGPHIGKCCYEVGKDLYDSVSELRGEEFAKTFITPSQTKVDKYYCDMTGMNVSLLCEAGIKNENIDISPLCTMCESDIFYSHRKTQGKRGAMGAGIVII